MGSGLSRSITNTDIDTALPPVSNADIDTALLLELWVVVAACLSPAELTMLCDLGLALTAKFTPLVRINLRTVVFDGQLNVMRWAWARGVCSIRPNVETTVTYKIVGRSVHDVIWPVAAGRPDMGGHNARR